MLGGPLDIEASVIAVVSSTRSVVEPRLKIGQRNVSWRVVRRQAFTLVSG